MVWSFIQLSDIHIGVDNPIKFQPGWVENFFTAIEQIKGLEKQPDFIIVSGDMTRDGKTKPEELQNIKNIFAALDWPVYVIPGNHDVGNRYRSDKKNVINLESLNNYKKIMGDDKFSFEHKGILFSGFNSFLFASGLEDAEKELWSWLENLSNNNKIPQFWFMHSASFIESPHEPEAIIDSDNWYYTIGKPSLTKLLALLEKGGIQSISCGHIHKFTNKSFNGTRFVSCPSTAFVPSHSLNEPNRQLGFIEWTVNDTSPEPKLIKLAKYSNLVGCGFDPGIPTSQLT